MTWWSVGREGARAERQHDGNNSAVKYQRETPNYIAIRTRIAADQCHPMEETPPSSWEVSEEGPGEQTAEEEEIKTEEDQ